MRKLLIIIVMMLSLFESKAYLNNGTFSPTSQSNPNLDFGKFMSGVNKVYIVVDDNILNEYNSYKTNNNKNLLGGLKSFLSTIGHFSKIEIISVNLSEIDNSSSICNNLLVYPSWKTTNQFYYEITLDFMSCLGDSFSFTNGKSIYYNNIYGYVTFHNHFMELYGYKVKYDYKNRLQYFTNYLPNYYFTSENDIKNILDTSSTEIEGIYESLNTTNGTKYKIAILKDFNENKYNCLYIDGASNYLDWKLGELKATFYETATPNFYKCNWYMAGKVINNDVYITFKEGNFKLLISGKEDTYLKLYPTSSLSKPAKNIKKKSLTNQLFATGSAFAVTSDGYVVTNNHVIEGATELKIRGVAGDMKKSYTATVISKDEKNDLAILKIDDPNFTGLGNVPINIVQKPIEVGSSIFVLGYPMIDAMGDEIKLTDGKISSRTGYQGDVSTYQISAPIQPGNSGGPLFDEEGNLIGITSSGIIEANSVGYAIKTSYLMNMFDALQDYPNLTKTNTISKKKLPEKIKVLQKFIYIIENYQ
jgi:hypothetical protein